MILQEKTEPFYSAKRLKLISQFTQTQSHRNAKAAKQAVSQTLLFERYYFHSIPFYVTDEVNSVFFVYAGY